MFDMHKSYFKGEGANFKNKIVVLIMFEDQYVNTL